MLKMDLKNSDKEIYKIIKAEKKRQFDGLEMIASENYVSRAVLEAQGSILTNKYAEGYPQHRYYGGCREIDKAETLAIERAKKLFKVKYVNVQPHSGTTANLAAYLTLMKPGDRLLGQDLSAGGHLSHGSRASFSGQLFDAYSYGVDKKTGMINYDEVLRIVKKIKPKVIICGSSAYPRKIDFAAFRKIANKVGAYLVADIAHIAGLVVTGLHQSPIPYADIVTSTTQKTLRGPRGGIIMTNNKELAVKIDKTIFPGIQGGPFEHTIAAKAVCFAEALKPSFKKYQAKVLTNMKMLVAEMQKYEFEFVTGSTDNHLALIDLRNKKITGRDFECALEKAGITVNKNVILDDPESPTITSGIRIGTAAITTRGMGKTEMTKIAEFFALVAENINDDKKLAEIKSEVHKICQKFPIQKSKLPII
ncbi:MAG: serine hydroxymethyltransferase [Candidatus Brennerbacteria bacterium CG11_big_fil_rev_8_21_14_0_20_43_10]|uniref:Probable serine hydroxymethyltransferase n=2 Tax=Bacteria candidate phyla TaxID=1783234 RepID=A0A2H0PY96_9BACT|nr:MAG: serine hydroxymethyltransferase [Candidatus Brennerbacteria bacterium CG11_big_fil_rev_8_21_14_0_20_43_10]